MPGMKFRGAIVGLVLFGVASTARAEVAAIWAEGQGGLDSPTSQGSSATPALGLRLGARLFVFEGYLDHTGFGDGSAVNRGIVGLRGGFGSGDTRLVLRAGAGVLDEEGFPLRAMGILQAPARPAGQMAPQAGRPCPECGNATLIHKDGCDFCTACGHIGSCG
jgi:hypothetical protein